ncbi:Nuclear transport factor 2 [Sesamum alatum]|uniref:Nuclear transport factor 2 n=1 Tax=Sesamum alatum TaxID=300844 RepID=A0AAE1Y822_9LAMI|nr:Nuclear transport factor 2 [Sesamum alatum]
MATAFPLPVTAAQVGTYFVGQYYQMLQNQPNFVHQFYSDASTMLRIDGNTRETATAMLQIHQLIMSLNYNGIEIKTAHSLESWNGGVLVMVSGSVHVKDFSGRKKFVETFFLAPQEKGYFVLNDIFHYVDEEQILPHPISYLPQGNLDAKINSAATARQQANDYMLGGDIQSRELVVPAKVEENGPVSNYKYPEEQLPQAPETNNILDDNFAVQSNGSLQGTMNSIHDHLSSPIEEPIVETQKHTYASIVAKGQSAVPAQSSSNKPASSEWQHVPEPPSQPSVASLNQIERSGVETVEEASFMEDEVEVKSVYVRNVPTTMAASEIAEEFKKFGTLKPDAVAIRTRKDIDVCYAFVEFEDITGVQNAIKSFSLAPSVKSEFKRHPQFRLAHTSSTSKGGDRTETSLLEEEEREVVEEELATRRKEGADSVAVGLVGGAIKMPLTVTTTDQGATASTDKLLDKKEHTPPTSRVQETVTNHQTERRDVTLKLSKNVFKVVIFAVSSHLSS